MFITILDIYYKIRQADLNQITGGDTLIVANAISYAVGLVRSKVPPQYDVGKIFNATGDERDMLLVSICCDIAIYEVVSLAQPNIDLTDRRERKTQAIAYLDSIRHDNLPVAWPLVQNPEHIESPVESGGKPSRGNYL